MPVFKTWLKARHDERGWTQRDAAAHYGVIETNVSNWLNSETHPSMLNLIRISLGLGLPITEVLGAAGYEIKMPATIEMDASRRDERAAVLASLPQFAEILDLIARQPADAQAVYIALIRDQLLKIIPQDRPGRQTFGVSK